MRNKSLLIALAGAVVFGLIAAVSVSRYISQARAYAENLGQVVVARKSIPLGTKITADMLSTAEMPNGSKPDGVYDSVEKVAGRVAIANIGVREPVTNIKLAIEGAAGGLPAVIPEGYRAMTVKVDDVVGVSGFIMPGAFVDVVAVVTQDSQSGQDPISKVVLQNIKVLASGAKIDQPADSREPTAVKAVTLQVLPDEAEKLALAATEGKLQLVMRNFGDQEAAVTTGVSKRSLLTGEPFSFSAKPAAPAQSRPAETQPAAPTQPRPIYMSPRPESPAPAPVATQPQQPPPSSRSVELFEGAKKRSVDFP